MNKREKFVIEGGKPLKGEVTLCGAKNSGFKLMIASLYADGRSEIRNFSKITDTFSTGEIIRNLGGEVIFGENHIVTVSGKSLSNWVISSGQGKLSRAATYFIGPFLSRFGKAVVSNPGGCKIGRRPLDRHFEGIKALGAKIKGQDGHYLISAKELKGTRYRFPKVTHGGTDVMVITSVLAKGKTVLENAALEPEIDDLIAFLNKMGAKIERKPGRIITIEGVKELKSASHSVMPDRNEAVTFACAALATKGDVLVKGADKKVLGAFLEQLDKVGGGYEIDGKDIRFYYKKQLSPCNILTHPYPGFMTDWMAVWSVLMTQAKGESVIHETIFENRFAFFEQLIKMGVKVKLFNPRVPRPEEVYSFNLKDDRPEYFHAARIFGPATLKPARLEIADLRAGATLILASLIAKGKSELTGAELVDRGYENLDEKLRGLKANIKRTE
ncbi:MAG: UDP-N-acetylglucosamine 1-carboxyvinyltransferase 2 [Microgenomates group bacterium ADurb.Bin219]|nr:MAG: UDP-N-acetylglucosamine 1-carboxyvinyltransferase 2 [Microgenomates group bacterium ADurb.Bin219]HNP89420.1 UDP-N-acetylglucosamine 1-carboxyvinyltransferase [Candidatus Woesebacteria bacterium]